jgi:hypothetical protein
MLNIEERRINVKEVPNSSAHSLHSVRMRQKTLSKKTRKSALLSNNVGKVSISVFKRNMFFVIDYIGKKYIITFKQVIQKKRKKLRKYKLLRFTTFLSIKKCYRRVLRFLRRVGITAFFIILRGGFPRLQFFLQSCKIFGYIPLFILYDNRVIIRRSRGRKEPRMV